MRHSGTDEWVKQSAQKMKDKRAANIEEYSKKPKRCLLCSTPLQYDKRQNTFCSRSCSQSFNNKGVRRHGRGHGDCLACGSKLTYQNKFCSNRCQTNYCYKKYIEDWVCGKRSGCVGEGVSPQIKRYLLEKYNSKCQECGWSRTNPSTGKVPLTVHHDDGNWKNSRPENLRLYCPNCHSLTPTYGSKNWGKGRLQRKILRQSKQSGTI